MRQEVVGGVPGSLLGMLADLNLKLRDGSIAPEQLELFLKGRQPFVTPQDALAEWSAFYRDVFSLEKDFSGLTLPAKRKGFDRLIVVAAGMTPNRLFDKCKELFPAWRYIEDLDANVTSDRKADHDYAIWVRDRVEADDELKKMSAEELQGKNVTCETLEERLLHELKYHQETGQHLDLENVTLCPGSRSSDGYVVRVYWHDDELHVRWRDPQHANPDLRGRAAVI